MMGGSGKGESAGAALCVLPGILQSPFVLMFLRETSQIICFNNELKYLSLSGARRQLMEPSLLPDFEA